MKKNIFPFIPDADLIDDVNCLLKLIRQPLRPEEFFNNFPNDTLNAKDELEYENDEKSLIIKENGSTTILNNELLSEFGITNKTQLIEKLNNNNSKLTLKDSLKEIINSAEKERIEKDINRIQEKNLNTSGNDEDKINIELFFIFLKTLILQKNSRTLSLSANTLLEKTAHLTSWFISDGKKNILEPGTYYSKKYNEIDTLISKLYSFFEASYLATQLRDLNNQCLQQLLNIDCIENLSKSKKAIEVIEVIENFQLQAPEIIKEFQKNNPLSLEQLNILHKILNAVAKLMPSFILPKKTRIGFFQQYTPQKRILIELEKTIQPFSPSL